MTGLRRFARNRLAVVGAVALAVLVLFVLIGPLVYPTEQVATDLGAANLPPGVDGHPLGTDALGYDNLGRLMVAGRVSLLVGVLAGALATVVGTLWGAVAGYVGGVVDGYDLCVEAALSAIDAGAGLVALDRLRVAFART